MVFPSDSKLYFFYPNHLPNFDCLPRKDRIYIGKIAGLLAMNAHNMKDFNQVDEPMLARFLGMVGLRLVGRTLNQKSNLMYNSRIIIPCWERMSSKGFGQYVLAFSLRQSN